MFYHPSRRKLKYFTLILVVLFLVLFSSIFYGRCPAFVQCSPEEAGVNPVCAQTCYVGVNFTLLLIVVIASYLISAVVVHHSER